MGDARDLPYASASFDGCVSTLVIDVIPDVDLVASQMRRVNRCAGVQHEIERVVSTPGVERRAGYDAAWTADPGSRVVTVWSLALLGRLPATAAARGSLVLHQDLGHWFSLGTDTAKRPRPSAAARRCSSGPARCLGGHQERGAGVWL